MRPQPQAPVGCVSGPERTARHQAPDGSGSLRWSAFVGVERNGDEGARLTREKAYYECYSDYPPLKPFRRPINQIIADEIRRANERLEGPQGGIPTTVPA